MICPQCHKKVPDESKFCLECGYKLTPLLQKETPEAAFQIMPSGERRVVTILFADLKGFTSFSEGRDPEEIRDILDTLFKEFRDEIISRGGHVDKYIGDAVMAVFGVPDTFEDDPARAIDAALAMQEVMARFNEHVSTQHGLEGDWTDLQLHIRIGINTGEVLWGSLGGDSVTVMGDAVNVAQRLESITPSGTILVGRETQKLVGSKFIVRMESVVSVKGRKELVQPYRVLGRRELDPALHGLRGIIADMIGRDKELTELIGAYEKTTSTGKPCFVLVTGEAGAGKSRLIHEFLNYLVDLPEMILTLQGRCVPYGSGPLHPIREMMRQYISKIVCEGKQYIPSQMVETENGPSLVDRFVERVIRDLDQLGRYNAITLENIAHVLGLSVAELSIPGARVSQLGPKERHEALLHALSSWFSSLCVNYPTVLVFEDMHWSDPSSLEALERYFNLINSDLSLTDCADQKGCGLLVIVVARCEIRDKWTASRTWPGEQVSLEVLGGDQITDLARQTLDGTLSPEVMNFIVTQSGGNPYYLEELIKFMLETGNIERVSSGKGGDISDTDQFLWQITPGVSLEKGVPTTLSGIIGARIDTLPEKSRRVLTNASVIGRIFWENMVSQMVQKAINEELSLLERRQLVFGRTPSEMPDDNEYVFQQVLLREVVYGRLIRKDRQKLHCIVVSLLDELMPGQVRSTMLALKAWHQSECGPALPAVNTYSLAAKQATVEGLPEDTYAYLGKALELLPRTRELSKLERDNRRAVLLELRGNVAHFSGRLDTAFKDFTAALKYSSDTKIKASCIRKKANILRTQGDVSTARKAYQKAMSLVEGNPLEQTSILIDMAYFEGELQSNYGEAEKLCEQALQLIIAQFPALKNHLKPGTHNFRNCQVAHPILKILADTLLRYGIVYCRKSDLECALEFFQTSLTICEEIGFWQGVGITSGNLGVFYHDRGDLDQALKFFQKSLSISEEIGYRQGVGINSGNIGNIYRDRGDLDQALEYYQKCLTICQEVGYRQGVGRSSGNIGSIYHDRGDLDQALEYHQKYQTISEEIGDQRGFGVALGNLGYVYLTRGDLNRALELFQKRLDISKKIGDRFAAAEAYLFLSETFRVMGDLSQSQKLNYTALAIFKELNDQRRISDCWCFKAESDLDGGDLTSARQALARGAEGYKQYQGGTVQWRIPLVEARLQLEEVIAITDKYNKQSRKDLIKQARKLTTAADQSQLIAFKIEALVLSGQALALAHLTDEAQDCFSNALNLAQKYGFGQLERRIKPLLKASRGDLR